MKLKENILKFRKLFCDKFEEQYGFQMTDISATNLINYLHAPKDSSSLAVTRILFGLAMLFDIPDERGGAIMDRRWGDPRTCRFPLLPFVWAAPMPYMALVYAALWFGALGIMLGYKYRISSTLFTACYWYLLLIEKSYWNNHSYLFGLVGFLLTFTQANCCWSLDTYLDPSRSKELVPYWNYFVLKYQFFILYFMAGMKKGTAEWLTGYSVPNLSEHWVFAPFRLFLTVPQIDYLVVHWFVFAFDLTVAVWMMWSATRHTAMVFCALFHLMNSRLFSIGMFPWVCLATMPLFYPFDWPKLVFSYLVNSYQNIMGAFYYTNPSTISDNDEKIRYEMNREKETVICDDNTALDDKRNDKMFNDDIPIDKVIKLVKDEQHGHIKNIAIEDSGKSKLNENITSKISKKILTESIKDIELNKKITTCLLFFYILMQALLPYSHFITKGYNNWTNGLYGYSWDMMVHSWDTQSVVIKVVDNDKHKEFYIDPYVYSPNDRWAKHGDMVYQYAHCLKDNLVQEIRNKEWSDRLSENISIYVDVWCSMNGRFTQRMFDPKVDLLTTWWSPFMEVPFLMPLLDEALDWRSNLYEIKQQVQGWSNHSDVIFIADFPGYEQEKFIPLELSNVTLTILQGPVVFETEVTNLKNGHSYLLKSGHHIGVDHGQFHRVINIGETPAYYMYTFNNITEIFKPEINYVKPKIPIFKELYVRLLRLLSFVNLVFQSISRMCFWMTQCH